MHIVIVGGGFAGVKTALELDKEKNFNVTLISDKDHFVYYPTLYAMATGHSHLETIVPLEKIFRGTRVKIVQDTITGYDPARHIISGSKEYHYDKIVLALGVVTSYFGIKGLQEYSYNIKSYDEVLRFRTHLHDELIKDHHVDKHYIVVGAGPTGVELSAALVSYLELIATSHKVKHSKISIRLVEAAPRVLPRLSEAASDKVEKRLRSLGVDVRTNEKVQEQDSDSIMINGKDVLTQSVVWTSGVSNHPFFAQHSAHFPSAANSDRVAVDEQLMVNSSTYVIGDNAATAHTGLAQTALHNALFVARDIKNAYHHKNRETYKPVKPPVVVPVGLRWAALEWNGVVVTGVIAAIIRRIADFIGFSDILPIGQALGIWRAGRIHEETCPNCDKSLI